MSFLIDLQLRKALLSDKIVYWPRFNHASTLPFFLFLALLIYIVIIIPMS
jgi:hypothetical protein